MMVKRIVSSWLLVALALGPAGSLEAQATADADLEKGVLQVQSGDFEAALLTLDGVVRRLAGQRGAASDLARTHVYLGMAYLGLDQEPGARARFQDAWRADKGMKPSASEFPPRVLRLLEEARKEVLSASAARTAPAPQPSPQPTAEAPAGSSATAPKKGGSKLPLVLVGVAAAAGAGVALAGGGSSSSASAPSTPTPIGPQVLLQSSFGSLARGTSVSFPLNVGTAGMLTAKAQWTSSRNEIWVYLTTSFCSASGSPPASCTLADSLSIISGVTNTLSYRVTPGSFRVFVYNTLAFSESSESGTIQVTLTP